MFELYILVDCTCSTKLTDEAEDESAKCKQEITELNLKYAALETSVANMGQAFSEVTLKLHTAEDVISEMTSSLHMATEDISEVTSRLVAAEEEIQKLWV